MLKSLFTVLILCGVIVSAANKPNVIVIITDDQGYGDFGVTGNHLVQTPHIDEMAKKSFEFTRFYVNAVCSPTRASLMTGRQSYRTGVTDTWIGRSTMMTEEVTIAEILKDAGYGTGLFGKWHLGDNYPYRPMDQGFDKAIYHQGGGLGQPADPIENKRRYTDAILLDNGKQYESKGFCCDVYFDEAMKWISTQKKEDKPFFAYIATNTPHTPLHDVPQKWLSYYMKKDLSKSNFKQDKGHPIAGKDKNDRTAAIYAMVSNIDDNVGRLFSFLNKEQLTKDTLVIYMSDNGPDGYRYVGGFKGKKSMNTEGGLRTPIWFHYPEKFPAGGKNTNMAAHVDLFPTIAELCGAQLPKNKKNDGISLLPALKGGEMNKRSSAVIIQSHRGTKPERMNNTAILKGKWKLMSLEKGKLGLFDLESDPYATKNVIAENPEVQHQLLSEYENLLMEFDDEYPNIWGPKPAFVGTPFEKETFLTRQDWRDQIGKGWSVNEANGTWYIDVKKTGKYELQFNLLKPIGNVNARLKVNGKVIAAKKFGKSEWYKFPVQTFKKGPAKIFIDINNGSQVGPWHVKIAPVE